MAVDAAYAYQAFNTERDPSVSKRAGIVANRFTLGRELVVYRTVADVDENNNTRTTLPLANGGSPACCKIAPWSIGNWGISTIL